MFTKRMMRLHSDLAFAVCFNNQEVKGKIANMSMNGIFSEMEEPIHAKISDLVEVEIFCNRPENEVHVVMECKIARMEGLQFAFQLHAIDYDALMMYKKILSEICGDEAAIDRELSAFETGFDEINEV